jgi:hypothetical protein
MKALIAEDVMLCYLDHNLPFHIYTDASDYQLGAMIMQNNKPVAYLWCQGTTCLYQSLQFDLCQFEFSTCYLMAFVP